MRRPRKDFPQIAERRDEILHCSGQVRFEIAPPDDSFVGVKID
jgi:hypothetical protein